jgi:hypothetical protein
MEIAAGIRVLGHLFTNLLIFIREKVDSIKKIIAELIIFSIFLKENFRNLLKKSLNIASNS